EKKIPFVAIPDEVYVTNDEGLLGFAFHPEFSENRKYYLMYETKAENYRGMAIGERIASKNYLKDSGKPTKKILEFEVATQFHHGGGIEFGPDGYLYIGMGDGGPQEDPLGHAQDLESFSGKILRIDVNKKEQEKSYSIPKGNPFNNHPNKKVLREIYAYGLRQPWRFSFDSFNGDLWVGDVGQNRFEEVTIVRAGENHGWNVYEGFELFSTQYRKEDSNFIAPIISFRRSHGVSITGGYVIRSKTNEKSSFEGVYICADYQSKKIWGLTQSNRKLESIREIGQCPDRIVAFGRDRSYNLYAIGYDKGTIYKLDFSEATFK
ncbi:MAG: PQQ-dependent sugar dehydrogenase, partial [Verrucomicrobiales bacterium]|nr:PQQ-dependent sugar dehydrogenase [Verrucomicrobiales bacterium]